MQTDFTAAFALMKTDMLNQPPSVPYVNTALASDDKTCPISYIITPSVPDAYEWCRLSNATVAKQ